MKKAVVTGAGGFIGHHLVSRLKQDGYWVRGVDLKMPAFSPTKADEFVTADLRDYENCKRTLKLEAGIFDEVYHLAADMGGMGFISSQECEIMRNSALMNNHMIDAAVKLKIPKYFFSSSVCVYRNMMPGEPQITEEEAYPANPHNEYGWEKLYAERMVLAFSRKYGIDVRIARFQNCFGPEGAWRGGREKAPAAVCRRIAWAKMNKESKIELWGHEGIIRSYTYIDDMIEGVRYLMNSNQKEPVNIGSSEYISLKELAAITAKIAGVPIRIDYIPGPTGVESRNFSHAKIEETGWRAKWNVQKGMSVAYPWIENQLREWVKSNPGIEP